MQSIEKNGTSHQENRTLEGTLDKKHIHRRPTKGPGLTLTTFKILGREVA